MQKTKRISRKAAKEIQRETQTIERWLDLSQPEKNVLDTLIQNTKNPQEGLIVLHNLKHYTLARLGA